jgi:hypothetical protein
MQKIRRQEGIMGAWSDLKEGVKVVGRGMLDKTKSAEAKPVEKAPVEKAPPTKPFASIGSTEKSIKDRGAELKKLDPYKKGGKVKKTGPALVHKGERVLTTKQSKKLDANPAMKKAIGVKKAAPMKKAAKKSLKK